MQLKMKWTLQPLTEYSLKDCLHVESFRDTVKDKQRWLDIILPDFPEGDPEALFTNLLVKWPDCCLPEDVFFICDAEGKALATSTAVDHPDGTGYVHMFWAGPASRGLGVGHFMLYETLSRLVSRGSKEITLTTDDFRLAAIKIYLDAGFVPVNWGTPEDKMEERWKAVYEALQYGKPLTMVEE